MFLFFLSAEMPEGLLCRDPINSDRVELVSAQTSTQILLELLTSRNLNTVAVVREALTVTEGRDG